MRKADVLVIGAGPGGYVAAIRAAQMGRSVIIVEREKLGGVCLNQGCIPSKSLISVANLYYDINNSTQMGIKNNGIALDFNQSQIWKAQIIEKLTNGINTLLKGNKVDIIYGEAHFISEKSVQIVSSNEKEVIEFNYCILATGSRPIELKQFPFGEKVLSSSEILSLPYVPKRLAIIGAGYIGLELSQAFAKMGSSVTIIENRESILPEFPQNITKILRKKLNQLGIKVHTHTRAESMRFENNEIQIKLNKEYLSTDILLVTVGRIPNTDNINLNNAGVEVNERGFVTVNNQCRTTNSRIFAIGDIINGPALAHKASYEGKIVAEIIAGNNVVIDYKCIPKVVYSDPEIATVGLSIEEAENQGLKIRTETFSFAANARALTVNSSAGFVQIIIDEETHHILGATIIGPEASELIAEWVFAIEHGSTVNDIALIIHSHPSLSEVNVEVSEKALGLPIHSL